MAQFLKDLLLDGYNGAKPIETKQKRNGLGQQVKDVVSAESSKTGPRVLFYKRLPSLYGTDLPRISSKGSIDPARTLAVKSSRYVDTKNAGGGGFGRFLSNLLGGSANRPSDTIFPANDKGQGDASKPPVSVNGQPIGGDWNGLKYAVEPDTNYAVSQEPAGTNILTGLLKGSPSDIARNAVGAATGAAKQAIGKLATNALTGKRKKAIGNLKDKIAASKELNSFGAAYNSYEKPGSEYIKLPNVLGLKELVSTKDAGIRRNDRHYLIDNILLKERLFDYTQLSNLIKQNTGNRLQYIKIKIEGTSNSLVFPATITDIQDNITPEWNSFKYVGSPFNNYRYRGVERKIGFDFRVYWINNGEQIVMRDKLNVLRQLGYPSNYLTSIPLNGNTYKPLVFSPTTIQLSIGDLYKNLKGFVSNVSITVPQDAPWATSNPNFLKENANIVYPTFVDVSFEMTIIENHDINAEDELITYRFDEAPEFEPVKKRELPTQPTSTAIQKIENDKLIDKTMFKFNDDQIRTLLKDVPQIEPTVDDSYIKNY
jgi:uncharacterized protein YjbJ (UPF0337 family)